VAERRIVLYGDPVLREMAAPVDKIDQEVKDLVSDMMDTLKNDHGLGLAAPQVGESKRVFIIDLSSVDLSETVRVFINPEILSTDGEVELEEGAGMAEVIAAMKEKIPTLEGPVIRDGENRLEDLYKFNINGRFYFDGMDFELHENDRIALLVPATGG